MLIRVDVPFSDVRAADLALTLGAAPEPALEVLRVDGIELRLLGCSHQAIAAGVSETVACRPGRSDPLPARVRRGEYAFHARVDRLAPAAYAARARELIANCRDDDRSLVGVFPGYAQAFTALHVLGRRGAGGSHRRRMPSRVAAGGGPPGQITWETWHGYPQTGELVHTRSTLEHR